VTERYEQRPYTLPPGSVEIVLVRHGASAAYVPGEAFEMLEGIGNPVLAPEGEAQAVRLCERLAGEDIDTIYVSTLQRTAQTAAPLAARLGLEPRALDDLREVGLGEWDGGEFRVRARAGDPLLFELFTQERWDVIPGAEAKAEYETRIKRAYETVLAEAVPDSRVVVVAHGGVITEICRLITGSRPFAFLSVDNASITRIGVLPDGRTIMRSFNDTAHLA
jgi:probable phosphoglycerate mutase